MHTPDYDSDTRSPAAALASRILDVLIEIDIWPDDTTAESIGAEALIYDAISKHLD